jgi:hypothetical protein
MKTVVSALGLIFLCFLITSCANDDTQVVYVEPDNILKVGNNEFHLKSVIYQTQPTNNDLFAYEFILYDTSIMFINGEPVTQDNIVNGIALGIYSDNSEKPSLGEYVFAENMNPVVNTIGSASILSNINVEDQTGNTIEIEFGILKILENDSEYVLNFDGIDEEDNEISMYYRGTLISVEN